MEKLDESCARQRGQQEPKPERGVHLACQQRRKAREPSESNGEDTKGVRPSRWGQAAEGVLAVWLRNFDFILTLNRTSFRIFSREMRICFILSDDPSSCRITRRGLWGGCCCTLEERFESGVGWGRGEGEVSF